jgi:hypothetical protein
LRHSCPDLIPALIFINPEENDREDETEVKKIWRDPEKIDRGYRGKEKGEKIEKRAGRWIGQREAGKAHEQDEKKQQRVKNEEAVIPEDSDERSGEQGISPRFGIENFIVLGFFQEDALRTGIEIVIVADQVLFCIFKVAVVGNTLSHSIIDRLVGKQEIAVDGREVDEKRKTQEKEKDQKYNPESRSFFWGHQHNLSLVKYHSQGQNSMTRTSPSSGLRGC